jgi:hypothetical protein
MRLTHTWVMARSSRGGRRPPLASPEAVEDILGRAGESRFARVRPPIAAKVWRDAVGARIAERAVPISLYGASLVLRVASSVWAHELSLLSEDVCSRLRERGVEVRELRFRVGAMAAIERPPERRTARAVPKTREIPAEVSDSLAQVESVELREAIERAAASNLAWQSLADFVPRKSVTEAQRGARAPRSAARETSPPDRTSPASREATRGTRGGARGRPR